MKLKKQSNPGTRRNVRGPSPRMRRGAFLVMAFFSLMAAISFVALSVDLGVISLEKTRLQNAVDAAALAAAQEITSAVEQAGEEAGASGGQVQDANSIAEAAARAMAAHVADLNGVYVHPDTDVRFGKRVYNEDSGQFDILWDVGPYNVVQVTARRDNTATGQPDSQLELFFAGVFGEKLVSVRADAIAFVEARDMVVVLDFSGSMNYDSQLRSASISKLGQEAIEDNLYQIWQDLGAPSYGNMSFEPDWVTIPTDSGVVDVTWKGYEVDVTASEELKEIYLYFTNGRNQRFRRIRSESGTFEGSGSNSGQLIESIYVKTGNNWEEIDFFSDSDIKRGLGLNGVPYPFPSGSWENYIDYARNHSSSMSWYSGDIYNAGYRRKFGILTFMNFLLANKDSYNQTPVLWKTHHYPFQAVKSGTTLLTEFLAGLDFGDQLGLVSYDTYHRVETVLDASARSDDDITQSIDISGDPITDDYEAINQIQIHKQAAHYYSTTNIGGGILEAKQLLDEHRRYGARPTILLMTDGNANVKDNRWSMPSDWSWSELMDYDGDGSADYYTNDSYKKYALGRAKEAVDEGYTIHTMSVGANADRDLMRAIAHMGGGIWIDVPGGSTVAEMEEQMLAAFAKIAANVPPARIYNDPNGD